MKIPSRIVDFAVEEARKSEYYPHHLGAVIFNKHKVISKACNKVVNGPILKYLNRKVIKRDDQSLSIHAEMDALIKANYSDLNGASICVVRINKKGEFRLARPCDNCMMHLIAAGIKNIIYSISSYPYLQIERIN